MKWGLNSEDNKNNSSNLFVVEIMPEKVYIGKICIERIFSFKVVAVSIRTWEGKKKQSSFWKVVQKLGITLLPTLSVHLDC